MTEKLAYGFPDDQKYKSDDSFHRVWVTDVGDRILLREAQGYRRYREKQGDEWNAEVRRIVGQDRTAVLMEIPQAGFHAIMGDVARFTNEIERTIHRNEVDDYYEDLWTPPPRWSRWRILCFPAMGEPFTALLNFTRGDRSIRLVLRYHNDRYWYVRLRWWPWKFTCELRRRETEDDRLDRKYRDAKALRVPGVAEGEDYEIKSKW